MKNLKEYINESIIVEAIEIDSESSNNFDEFLDKLSLWIEENNFTKEDAATKLGISRGLFRFWFSGGVISISTYNKIQDNLKKYNLL